MSSSTGVALGVDTKVARSNVQNSSNTDVSLRETLARALPFVVFVAVIFFTLQTTGLSGVARLGLLGLQIVLGFLSIVVWIRRSPTIRG